MGCDSLSSADDDSSGRVDSGAVLFPRHRDGDQPRMDFGESDDVLANRRAVGVCAGISRAREIERMGDVAGAGISVMAPVPKTWCRLCRMFSGRGADGMAGSGPVPD